MSRKSLSMFAILMLWLPACSGPQTEEDRPIPPEPPLVAPEETKGDALTSEQMEEVQQVFKVGQQSTIECYEDELERRGNKDLEGTVMVKVQIGTAGRALRIEIGEASLQVTEVHNCIIEAIKGWEFPVLKSPFWYTRTYRFSPAY